MQMNAEINHNPGKGRLLIVDDEAKIRALIRKYAEFEGYGVEEAADGMEALEKARDEDFDLIVLDIMMPELDGFAVCRELRRVKQTPVLMLSARGEEYDKIHGFELGVDDYLVKPFSPRELMLRVNAILSRSQRREEDHDQDQFGGLVIDYAARLVFIDGERNELSPKVYDLLTYLAKNRGRALTREQLISQVWGYDYFGDDRTLDTHIKLLRLALGPYRDYVVTIRGVGYRFEG
ncbi:MAG: response regulator transcription factor [Clostridia bacterium]|nr:response regulator transcription factor [Clostridia bacterium]